MINTEKLFQMLSEIHPLPRKFREALKNEIQIISYPKNHYVVQTYSTAQASYYLAHGFAVACQFVDGQKIVTHFFKPNDIIISPLSFFQQVPATESIQLTVDSHLIALPYSSASKLFDKFPVANYISRIITARRYEECAQRLVDFHILDAWQRYLKLQKNFPGIDLNASQELIASHLNITPQSLSRLKKERN